MPKKPQENEKVFGLAFGPQDRKPLSLEKEAGGGCSRKWMASRRVLEARKEEEPGDFKKGKGGR